MPRTPQNAPEGYVSKITMKSIGCIPVGSDTPTDQCIVWGRALSTGIGKSQMPDGSTLEWTVLLGDFGAQLAPDKDGKVQEFRSSKLFLPAGIQEVVANGLVSEDGETKSIVVDFAFLMQTKKSSSKAGYQWVAQALVKPNRKNDPVSEIRAMFLEAAQSSVRELGPAALPEPAVAGKEATRAKGAR